MIAAATVLNCGRGGFLERGRKNERKHKDCKR
jgi:hypothetical protein